MEEARREYPRREPRIIKAPCLRCKMPVTVSRATYLFSITKQMNVGPFHKVCADRLTVEEEDIIWSHVAKDGPSGAGIVLP